MITHRHLSTLIETQAEKLGQKTAFLYRCPETEQWTPISWIKFSDTVCLTSKALLAIGTERQENVAVFSQNMPNCFYVNFACYGINAVIIPFYATNSSEQAAYMIGDADIRTIFVGEQSQYDTIFPLLSVCPKLKHIIIFDKKVVKHPADNISLFFDDFIRLGNDDSLAELLKERKACAQYDDTCDILYTSGTTGNSKGVILTYGMYDNAIRENYNALPISDKDIFLNILPLSHVFERGCAYLGLSVGAVQAINQNPHEALKAMREIRPTCLCAVPRFWEKVREGVLEQVHKSGYLKQKLFEKAMEVGRHVCVDYLSQANPLPMGLAIQYRLLDRLVYGVIRKGIGLDRGNFFPTAGAAISEEIEVFVRSCGINMVAGYGLTESTATVSCNHSGKPFAIGSVGQIIHGTEVRISEAGEILLRGKSITPRYYRKPEATAETIDAEGWFHTGDAGYIKDGHLFLTDRIKDLYKTSNGKYIAPQQIEAKLVTDKYIDQIMIIADRYKYVSALITPVYSQLEQYAKEHNIRTSSRQELCAHPQINKMLMERIDTLQQGLAKYEQVKRICILPQAFSMARGEMTNTLKLRRKVIAEHYAKEIEQMYE